MMTTPSKKNKLDSAPPSSSSKRLAVADGAGGAVAAAAALAPQEPILIDDDEEDDTIPTEMHAFVEYVSKLGGDSMILNAVGQLGAELKSILRGGEGRRVCILGNNGEGKSFLLNMLLHCTAMSAQDYEKIHVAEGSPLEGMDAEAQSVLRQSHSKDSPAFQQALDFVKADQEQKERDLIEIQSRAPKLPSSFAFVLPSANGAGSTTPIPITISYGKTWHLRIEFFSQNTCRERVVAFCNELRRLAKKQKTTDLEKVAFDRCKAMVSDEQFKKIEVVWNKVSDTETPSAEYEAVTEAELDALPSRVEDVELNAMALELCSEDANKPILHVYAGRGENFDVDRLYVRQCLEKVLYQDYSEEAMGPFVTGESPVDISLYLINKAQVYAPCDVVKHLACLTDVPGLDTNDELEKESIHLSLVSHDVVLAMTSGKSLAQNSQIIEALRESGFMEGLIRNPDTKRLCVLHPQEKDPQILREIKSEDGSSFQKRKDELRKKSFAVLRSSFFNKHPDELHELIDNGAIYIISPQVSLFVSCFLGKIFFPKTKLANSNVVMERSGGYELFGFLSSCGPRMEQKAFSEFAASLRKLAKDVEKQQQNAVALADRLKEHGVDFEGWGKTWNKKNNGQDWYNDVIDRMRAPFSSKTFEDFCRDHVRVESFDAAKVSLAEWANATLKPTIKGDLKKYLSLNYPLKTGQHAAGIVPLLNLVHNAISDAFKKQLVPGILGPLRQMLREGVNRTVEILSEQIKLRLPEDSAPSEAIKDFVNSVAVRGSLEKRCCDSFLTYGQAAAKHLGSEEQWILDKRLREIVLKALVGKIHSLEMEVGSRSVNASDADFFVAEFPSMVDEVCSNLVKDLVTLIRAQDMALRRNLQKFNNGSEVVLSRLGKSFGSWIVNDYSSNNGDNNGEAEYAKLTQIIPIAKAISDAKKEDYSSNTPDIGRALLEQVAAQLSLRVFGRLISEVLECIFADKHPMMYGGSSLSLHDVLPQNYNQLLKSVKEAARDMEMCGESQTCAFRAIAQLIEHNRRALKTAVGGGGAAAAASNGDVVMVDVLDTDVDRTWAKLWQIAAISLEKHYSSEGGKPLVENLLKRYGWANLEDARQKVESISVASDFVMIRLLGRGIYPMGIVFWVRDNPSSWKPIKTCFSSQAKQARYFINIGILYDQASKKLRFVGLSKPRTNIFVLGTTLGRVIWRIPREGTFAIIIPHQLRRRFEAMANFAAWYQRYQHLIQYQSEDEDREQIAARARAGNHESRIVHCASSAAARHGERYKTKLILADEIYREETWFLSANTLGLIRHGQLQIEKASMFAP